jgi:excisionase family DNA binding protein
MRLLTTSEVAMLLNVTDRTVRRWCMKGKLRHLRTPVRYVYSRRILIPEDAVEEFIKKYRKNASASAGSVKKVRGSTSTSAGNQPGGVEARTHA